MEKITYILGAGFSAPAGLPLMNNFILKAKDLYYDNPEKYKYFLRIFNKIEELSKIKNFFKADLYNIEEVLSLFETESFLYRSTSFRKEFIQFIIDVIKYYTFEKLDINFNDNIGNFHNFVLGEDQMRQSYGCFVCSILGIRIRRIEDGNSISFQVEKDPDIKDKYSIITLNYDTILENCLESIKERYKPGIDLTLNKDKYDQEWSNPHLVKLHGCINQKDIIPPTWAKSTTPSIEKIWRNAYNVIKDSTQIRIIGYSLPITDSNVRYLIKSAILKNQALKKIDVICLDTEGKRVKNLYDEFIDFNYYSFYNINSIEYLGQIRNAALARRAGFNGVRFNLFEKIHSGLS